MAPATWSTDVTARVFGYLNTNHDRIEVRSQSAGSVVQAPSQKPKRKPVPVRDSIKEYKQKLIDEYKQTRLVKDTERCDTYEVRDKQAPTKLRKKNDDKGTIREPDWVGARQREMKTVSRDDQLVERGANPRTGLVSPFVISDNSEEYLGNDYIAVDKEGSAHRSPRTRVRSGRWKQDSLGWSLVESPLLSPVAPRTSDKLNRMVSTERLEGRLLDEIRGVDIHDPKYMTSGQIKEYQEGIARGYKHGEGSVAVLNSNTLLFARQWTHGESSRLPAKSRKVQREEAGSRMVEASSLTRPRKDITVRQKVRVITPSSTLEGSSFDPCAKVTDAMGTNDPLLGGGLRNTCSQTGTQSQSYLKPGQAHQSCQHELGSNSPSKLSSPPAASQTSSHYLPHLEFQHPSHFTKLKTASYGRPGHLHSRLLGKKRRVVEDACTTIFTTTLTKGPRWGQRPKMLRQDGKHVVPRVTHLPPKYEKLLDGYHQTSTFGNGHFYRNDPSINTPRTSGLVAGRSRALGLTKKADHRKDLAETGIQEKKKVPLVVHRQLPSENRLRDFANPLHTTQGTSLRGANIAPEHIQRYQRGDGCTPVYDHLDDQHRVVPGEQLQYFSDDKEQMIVPAELAIARGSRVWFSGQRIKIEEVDKRVHSLALMSEESLARKRSTLREAANMKSWGYPAEALSKLLADLGLFQQIAQGLICHVVRTMHHASLALTILRMEKATTRDYYRAVKDLTLAAVYLLVFLRSLMMLRGLCVLVCNVLYSIWRPVQASFAIIEWCID